MKKSTPIEGYIETLAKIKSKRDQAETDRAEVTVQIGRACRELRERKRVSLRAMAKRLGFTAAYLSDLELGRRWWSEELLRKWREAL